MTIHISMNRAAGTATFAALTARGTDPWRQMCQALRNAGAGDDDVLVTDEFGTPCLTVKSAHACARNQDRRDRALAKLKARKAA